MSISQVKKRPTEAASGRPSGEGGRYKPRASGLHLLSQKEHRATPWYTHPALGVSHSLPIQHLLGECSLGSFCPLEAAQP